MTPRSYQQAARELAELVPDLAARVRCPAQEPCSTPGPFGGPQTRMHASINQIIIHLNDHHRYSRETIADWLDDVEAQHEALGTPLDLTVDREARHRTPTWQFIPRLEPLYLPHGVGLKTHELWHHLVSAHDLLPVDPALLGAWVRLTAVQQAIDSVTITRSHNDPSGNHLGMDFVDGDTVSASFEFDVTSYDFARIIRTKIQTITPYPSVPGHLQAPPAGWYEQTYPLAVGSPVTYNDYLMSAMLAHMTEANQQETTTEGAPE